MAARTVEGKGARKREETMTDFAVASPVVADVIWGAGAGRN